MALTGAGAGDPPELGDAPDTGQCPDGLDEAETGQCPDGLEAEAKHTAPAADSLARIRGRSASAPGAEDAAPASVAGGAEDQVAPGVSV
ncbi:hypothetical protein T492DRAFT_889282 [Pavlovales sp. CCMP2436]|nr:hypothetical protein T492DRAFT_889282 [Pavlovales sp. CCMP2436]